MELSLHSFWSLVYPEGVGRGESEKLRKAGWKYGAGEGPLKGGGAGTFPI